MFFVDFTFLFTYFRNQVMNVHTNTVEVKTDGDKRTQRGLKVEVRVQSFI